MLKPRRRITIVGSKGFQTNKVISQEINSGVEVMSDTAEIIIPRRLRVDGETYIIGDETDLFKVGDKVRIEMGYDSQTQEINLTKRYEGFIRRITPGDNVKIECEDEMFFCKQVNKQTQYLSPITIVDLAKALTEDVRTEFSGQGFDFTFDQSNIGSRKAVPFTAGDPFGIVCIDSQISGYRLKRNPNIAHTFKGLRTQFGFRTYFRDHIMYVGGLWYDDIPARAPETHTFTFQQNIVDNGRHLKYRRSEDFKMGVKVISINMDDNSRYEEFIGEEGGDLKTLHRMHRSIETESVVRANMQNMGKVELSTRNYTGYHGKFLTFAEPVVKHGDHAVLVDNRHELDRVGTYKVSHVRTIDSMKGQWQELTLHTRIDSDSFSTTEV
jgi:hypothetical protein